MYFSKQNKDLGIIFPGPAGLQQGDILQTIFLQLKKWEFGPCTHKVEYSISKI